MKYVYDGVNLPLLHKINDPGAPTIFFCLAFTDIMHRWIADRTGENLSQGTKKTRTTTGEKNISRPQIEESIRKSLTERQCICKVIEDAAAAQ
jgi:hypothetical protein